MTMEQFPPPSDEPDTGAEGAGGAPDTEDLGYFVSGVDLDAARGGAPEADDGPQLETRF